jgi:hypothetical protein
MRTFIWGALVVAATAAWASEPTDTMQLTAEAEAPRTVSRVGGGPPSGAVDLTVGLTAPPGTADITIRVLDASRTEWAGVERPDATTLRVPLGRPGIHEILIEATATVGGRAVRTETVVRVPFGVADPIADDGTFATFDLEPGR